MIITEPAALIIRETFEQTLGQVQRPRARSRDAQAASPFSSKAYAERGIRSAYDRHTSNIAASGTSARRSATNS